MEIVIVKKNGQLHISEKNDDRNTKTKNLNDF